MQIFLSMSVLLVHQAFLFASTPEKARQAMRDRVNSATSRTLYRACEGAKIATFANDHLIKAGLKQESLTQWEGLMEEAQEMVKQAITTKQAPEQYNQTIDTLEKAYDLFKECIVGLHESFGSYFTLHQESNKVRFNYAQNVLDVNHIRALNRSLKDARSLTETLSEIRKKLMDDIVKDVNECPVDTSRLPFPLCRALVKAYEPDKEYDMSFFKMYAVKDVFSATSMLDALEAYHKRLKQRDDKNAHKTSPIIARLQELFPRILSAQQLHKFDKSTNKYAKVLFSQSAAFETLLTKLTAEMKEIRAWGQKE